MFTLYSLCFVYKEGALGLTAQPHLVWPSHTHYNTGVVGKRVGTSSYLGLEVLVELSSVSCIDHSERVSTFLVSPVKSK